MWKWIAPGLLIMTTGLAVVHYVGAKREQKERREEPASRRGYLMRCEFTVTNASLIDALMKAYRGRASNDFPKVELTSAPPTILVVGPPPEVQKFEELIGRMDVPESPK